MLYVHIFFFSSDVYLESSSAEVNILVTMTDAEGREVINIASPACRKIILTSTYLFKRFEITSRVHESAVKKSFLKYIYLCVL